MVDASRSVAGHNPRVLVTRPLEQGQDLAERLADKGFTPVLQPLIEILPVEKIEREQRQYLLALDNYRHIIFVSTNAVRWGMDVVKSFWPQLPEGINWHAIGTATADTLAKHAVEVATAGGEMNSEALLLAESLQQVSGEKVLIVRGVGGRTLMGDELQRRGAIIHYLEVYWRKRPSIATGSLQAIFLQGVDIVLISSGEGLANLVGLLQEDEAESFIDSVFTLPIVTPGIRVTEQARSLGFRYILTAENATDKAMIDALSLWHTTGDRVSR